MTIGYDPALVDSLAQTLDLRRPNRDALDVLARTLSESEPGVEVVADLATGVGKTFIAAGLIDYLAEQGVRNIVIVTPGSTIQRKTVANLTPGQPKYVRGMSSNPLVITLDDLERGGVAQALDDESRVKVFVFTVQSLLRPNTTDARRAHRSHETLGVALYEYLQGRDDLVVIADEHHIYSGNARRFQSAIAELAPLALIGLTATPHPSTESLIVYRYPLKDAIADGYVKVPVLVGRSDGDSDLRTQLGDAVALLDAKESVMRAFCTQTRRPFVQPLLFVVASNIDEANEIGDMLAGSDLLGSRERVLVVTSEEPDATLQLLDTLEDPDSPIRAVVSVQMLQEGWDNRAIYVITATRALESELLTEQILGRGLRLPFPSGKVGIPMLDTVEVVSHNSFQSLLRNASVYLEQTLGDRQEEAAQVTVTPTATGDPATTPTVPVVTDVSQMESLADNSDTGMVTVELSGPTPATADPNQPALPYDGDGQGQAVVVEGVQIDRHTGLGIGTIEARLAEGEATAEALSTPRLPRTPGGVRIPLFIPQVTTRWVPNEFSLTQINLANVRAVGRTFADDNAPTLQRVMVDAERDSATGESRIVFHDAPDQVQATQTSIPFDSIQQDLAQRLMSSNAVNATTSEMNAATAIAQAFLEGAEVTPETPWRAEHGRLATARLVEWIGDQQTSSPQQRVVDISHAEWPDPAERIEAQPPVDRHLITRDNFTPHKPYSGWDKGIYDVNSFDAYSTEFRLAELFDRDPNIKAWVRVNETVPLRIPYHQGAIQRGYEPDFIVIDNNDQHWIVEGKANSSMPHRDRIVAAKRDAAREWVNTVNASTEVQQRWGYLLASEDVVAAASNWTALKAGADTHS